jgi:hypothetical protein
MLKSFSRGFSGGFAKFFTTERVAIIVVFLILAYALYTYSGSKSLRIDGMHGGDDNEQNRRTATTAATTAATTTAATTPIVSNAPQLSGGYTAQSVTAPQDLLPIDQNSQWAALNPVAQGNIAAPDLLQAGFHIGLDTIGQTLRNANLQERSDPIIPKSNIGPWNQSTIEPDLGRVPLEVGCGAR